MITSIVEHNEYTINIYHNLSIDIDSIKNNILMINNDNINAKSITEAITLNANIIKIDIYKNNEIILSTEYR